MKRIAACVVSTLLLCTGALADPIERVSVNDAGVQGNRVSDPGSVADGGMLVAFTTLASNLVPGDFDDGLEVPYSVLRDRTARTTRWLVQPALRSRSITFPVLTRGADFVVFLSRQSNLVEGDTMAQDVFQLELATGGIERVNQRAVGGNSAGEVSVRPSVSAGGRFVAFDSTAGDLVPGDTNGIIDIFVRDMTNASIERASVATGGAQSFGTNSHPSISGDGRYVTFVSNSSEMGSPETILSNVFLRDRVLGTTERVSLGLDGAMPNGSSSLAQHAPVSDNGRFILFGSEASNLVFADSNATSDVFLHDREEGSTVRISTELGGEQLDLSTDGFSMSADASRIVYLIRGPGGDRLVLLDRESGRRTVVNRLGNSGLGEPVFPSMSADGDFVIVRSPDSLLQEPDDGNEDVFIFDLRDVLDTLFRNGFE